MAFKNLNDQKIQITDTEYVNNVFSAVFHLYIRQWKKSNLSISSVLDWSAVCVIIADWSN